MAKRTRRTDGKPAPDAIRSQIKGGDDVDYDGLLEWYLKDCPSHLKGRSPDFAAFFSRLPPLNHWAGAVVALDSSTDG